VLDTRALAELFPDHRERGAPLGIPVAAERLDWLRNERAAFTIPALLVPRLLRNHGNHIVSLGALCRWLGEQAESLGCSVLPGFAAADLLIDNDRVAGVVTGDLGVARDGSRKPAFQPGYELRARCVVLAEGARGHLGRRLERRFGLRGAADPPHFGLGLKEIWQVDARKHRPGLVVHTFGWPLDDATEGGGFLYHAADSQVYLGLIVSLGYSNPHLDPFAEFQRWKLHPRIRSVIDGGQRIAYGARAINKGGLQSLPRLFAPGAILVGCEAGFLNGAKIKGSHTAMKTGLVAAEAVHAALRHGTPSEVDAELVRYAEHVRDSWVWQELRGARNFSPGIAKFGTTLGGALAFMEQNVLRGRVPYTLRNPTADHSKLVPADRAARISYPKPDGVVTFDKLSSVFLSSTAHEENQPVHLVLADPAIPIGKNLPRFDEPAQRYCPAGVYEVLGRSTGSAEFRINAANCVHCKTCDIKDPEQNITWIPPEGGGGPSYSGM
jgi:electron-transferring-flavoprotein dehydrogenase